MPNDALNKRDATIAKLRRLVARLAEYTEHQPGCASEYNFGARPCSCGLKELRLEQFNEGLTGVNATET